MRPHAKHMCVNGSNSKEARRLIIWTACGLMLVMPYDDDDRGYRWTDHQSNVTCLRCMRTRRAKP